MSGDLMANISAPAGPPDTDGSTLAETLRRALLGTGGEPRWQVASDGFWSQVTPREQTRRAQGWKLHISATPASADAVLARALPVLIEGRSAFKFARTIANVAELNARHTSRGQSGKFLTVYPHSDAEAVRLAEALHQATEGLPGPRVLSDCPLVPGSLVHYRYGAFVEERRLGNDGLYAWVIFDPDGNPVEDRRVGRYLPPAWASCPFPQPEVAAGASPAGGAGGGAGGGTDGVLIGDRFLVREAIRHANKGGVYRAVDTESGAQAIIKEARPHIAADLRGRDVRDLLRAEASALERLGPLGAAPRMLKLFEQSGHLFLAEELVPGVSLRDWVLDRIRTGGWRRHVPGARRMAERLIELLALAHRNGLILRDFSPNNVMVLPDGQLRLIDLELAVMPGEDAQLGVGTPGHSAPEQMAGAPAAFEADYFSLGADICFVLTGSTPALLPDTSGPGGTEPVPWRDRLAEWLAVRTSPETPDGVADVVLGLMQLEPEHRWSPVRAAAALASAHAAAGQSSVVPAPGHPVSADADRLDEGRWHRAVDGIVTHLLAAMDPTDTERLWPVSGNQGAPDPCIVQLGAAGVLQVLTRCLELTGDARLPEAIGTAGRWIHQRMRADAQRPPGLYFGRAGIAWSLYDAGRALGDDTMTAQGVALAEGLPVSSPNHDVTHGTAGIGLTFLHLWRRTGSDWFLRRAEQAAEALLTSATDGPDGLIWATPAAFDSRLAGGRYYGFAHGTAGVGHLLLAAAVATGRSDFLALASQAGETLLASATITGGTAQWGPGPGDRTTAPYWCHGSAGTGTFLTRLHRVTGDDRFDQMARLAAEAVMENSWRGVLGQCHGLAGNGEFLLDMAETGDRARYEAMAHRLARVLYASRASLDGNLVFPDEEGGVSAAWAGGVSGVLSFLLRLRHASPRLWMVDPVPRDES